MRREMLAWPCVLNADLLMRLPSPMQGRGCGRGHPSRGGRPCHDGESAAGHRQRTHRGRQAGLPSLPGREVSRFRQSCMPPANSLAKTQLTLPHPLQDRPVPLSTERAAARLKREWCGKFGAECTRSAILGRAHNDGAVVLPLVGDNSLDPPSERGRGLRAKAVVGSDEGTTGRAVDKGLGV